MSLNQHSQYFATQCSVVGNRDVDAQSCLQCPLDEKWNKSPILEFSLQASQFGDVIL